MTVETVVSLLAIVFTVAFAWPQVFRALRHGVDGVSVLAITQSLVSASAWFGYGLAQGLVTVMVADSGVILGQLLVTVMLVRNRALTVPRAVGVVALAAGMVALCQVPMLTTPIVVLAGIFGLTSAASQLVEVIREPDALEGLSAGTYALLTMMALVWLAYGFILGDYAIVVPNIVMIPMSGYITWAASRSHHEHEAEYEHDHAVGRVVDEVAPDVA